MHASTRALLAVLGGVVLFAAPPRVDAVVVCQKGPRIKLRAVACAGKELPVTLDATALPGGVEARVAEVEGVARARFAFVARRLEALESGVPLPACGGTAPECGGACPTGQVCSDVPDSTGYKCVCLPGEVGCGGDLYPTCGPGTCPTPTTCRQNAGWCNCVPPSQLP